MAVYNLLQELMDTANSATCLTEYKYMLRSIMSANLDGFWFASCWADVIRLNEGDLWSPESGIKFLGLVANSLSHLD